MESKNNLIDYDLVIYHGGCPDGLAGAWCYWIKMNRDNSKFIPGRIGSPPPNVDGKRIIFIDFIYNANTMKKILNSAEYVKVLDHHKSSIFLTNFKSNKLELVLDMDRSGAQLAWDSLNNDIYRPWFINDISDRDLWKWEIKYSKYTTRAMFGLGYYNNFESFDNIVKKNRSDFIDAGNLLISDDERVYEAICKRAVDCWVKSITNEGKKWKARLVNCESMYVSEIGNRLVEDNLCDFAAIFRYEPLKDEWWISLRANKFSSIDLTEVVKHFGNGGGHPKAAGFTIYGSKGHNLRTIFIPAESQFRFNYSSV